MRAFAAVPVAIMVCVAAPAFADAQSHVKAARKAERRREWRKALQEWKAAYKAEPNAEYLIGIGDANARLGNDAEARKAYEGYLADPFALPGNVQKVKAKLAQLHAPPSAGTLSLPGAGPTLPGSAAPPARKPEPTLPLPGLDLPERAPAQVARAEPAPAGLGLPGAAPAKKKEPEKVVSTLPPLPLPGAPPAAKSEAAPAVAGKEPAKPAKPIAMVTPERPAERAPVEALVAAPLPRETRPSGGVQRTMAFVTAGVAVAALGGGAFAWTKANSAHNDLTGQVHSGAEAQRLLENERSNKTLSFVGLAGGLVAAGISAALFAF